MGSLIFGRVQRLCWAGVVVAVILCSFSPSLGQRVFATLDPLSEGEDLKFDINDLPVVPVVRESDLNFSPNIVFAPDSSKAFVSYPRSDKVVAFDLSTAEIVQGGLIEVGKNPALISMTPDQKMLAVPSTFFDDNLPQAGSGTGQLLGSISIIDVETLETRTLELEDVFFSFANNIVFSADSKTGFLASSGTDEVLRFDVDTATEIEPRLKLREGTRPSSITMSPDFSLFSVVLVGSRFLNSLESPDSIELIDTASFNIQRTIVPKVEEGQLPHNLFATNTVVFSKEGKLGLIADREFSNLSAIPASVRDHVLLFDVGMGDVVQTLSVGGVASSATLAPDGRTFMVVCQLELNFIEVDEQDFNGAEELEVRRVVPVISNFATTTRPAFSPDGAFLFAAAPLNDGLLTVDLEAGVVRRAVEIGGEVKRQSGETEFTVSSAPLHLAFSPDGDTLAALNFNANTIDLLQVTTRFFLPFVSTNRWFTGAAMTNNDQGEAEIVAEGIDSTGIRLEDDPETENVVEYVNPATIRLGPGEQKAFTMEELFQIASGHVTDGWLDIDSDQTQVSGFFMIGDRDVERLDGGLASFATATRVVLPEARVTDGFNTEVFIINPNFNLAEVNISLFNHIGEKIGELDRLVSTDHTLRQFLRHPPPSGETGEGLFLDSVFEGFVSGYVVLTSPQGIVAFERYYDDQRLAVLNGVAVSDSNDDPSTPPYLAYLAQVAAFNGSETFMNLIHTGSGVAGVTLTLKNNEGDVLAEAPVQLEEGQAIRTNLVELFDLTDSGGPLSGWILLESDRPGVIADVEIQAFHGKAITAVPAQSRLLQKFVFSHVAQLLGLSTALALLNPGPESAVVDVKVFDRNGALVASLQISLGPGVRESKLLTEWFEDFPDLAGGYIKVSSDQGIVGLELFFADNLEIMASVPAQETM